MSSLSPEPETKLTIIPLPPAKRRRTCMAPECPENATMRIQYDHGFGIENEMDYCEPHHAQEVVNVAVDNRNVRAGFILF